MKSWTVGEVSIKHQCLTSIISIARATILKKIFLSLKIALKGNSPKIIFISYKNFVTFLFCKSFESFLMTFAATQFNKNMKKNSHAIMKETKIYFSSISLMICKLFLLRILYCFCSEKRSLERCSVLFS